MPPKTALLFEDNDFYREVLTEILYEQNFQVLGYTDPNAFLSTKADCCSAGNKPCADVMITDNQMPGMTGLEFLEHVRARGCRLPNACKAITSGNWDQQERDQAIASGCKVFHKPTSLEELSAWLDQVTSAPSSEETNRGET